MINDWGLIGFKRIKSSKHVFLCEASIGKFLKNQTFESAGKS